MLFDRLVEAAWRSGEPGTLFLDTINKTNPTPHLSPIEATNPCGKQPLLAYESCALGAINVARFLTRPRGKTAVDYTQLAKMIPLTIRFIEDVLDRTRFPLASIETQTKQTRKIALGIMGFSDLLIQLGVPYDTEKALQIADQRGSPSLEPARSRGAPLRHATVTTIAPTGTVRILADCVVLFSGAILLSLDPPLNDAC
jgi:ribonucleoside-diphosphate reductase alpha chain